VKEAMKYALVMQAV